MCFWPHVRKREKVSVVIPCWHNDFLAVWHVGQWILKLKKKLMSKKISWALRRHSHHIIGVKSDCYSQMCICVLVSAVNSQITSYVFAGTCLECPEMIFGSFEIFQLFELENFSCRSLKNPWKSWIFNDISRNLDFMLRYWRVTDQEN